MVLDFKNSIFWGLLRRGPPTFSIFLVLQSETTTLSKVLLMKSSKDPISELVKRYLTSKSKSSLSAKVFFKSKLYGR